MTSSTAGFQREVAEGYLDRLPDLLDRCDAETAAACARGDTDAANEWLELRQVLSDAANTARQLRRR